MQLPIGCHGTHATSRNDRRRPLWAAANRVRQEMFRAGRIAGRVRHVFGPRNIDTGPREAVVICLVRDAEMWIDASIDHYLAMGFRHVFLLDNGSEDSTLARAARHPHVSAWRTELPFGLLEVGMRRWLTRTFGHRRWALAPDADELWDYPCSDRMPLAGFLGYLESRGYKAVTAHALDMFSDVPFDRLESAPGDDLREKYRFFDDTDIITTREMYWIRNGQTDSEDIVCTFGGIRQRVFGTRCLCQSRHALHFADHESHPYKYDGHFTAGARIADVTTVLLHYKFIGTLYDQARRVLELAQHPGGGVNYRGFAEVLAARPDLCLRTDTATELSSVNDLVGRGFLTVSPEYLGWVESSSRVHT